MWGTLACAKPCVTHLALWKEIMFQVHRRKHGKVPEERQVTLETAKDNSNLCYLPASLTKCGFDALFCV